MFSVVSVAVIINKGCDAKNMHMHGFYITELMHIYYAGLNLVRSQSHHMLCLVKFPLYH